ncbi:DNA polymerase III subunit delta' [Geobacter sp. DSM 9736]|uniref:DNA polymerase III subunit delta' n=1 Tax=Geobacter sp. DSM 9736 TaxID=1277350 RepID=UPI000B50AAE2|nr:DNA polymerase III subunit delta' [Geobacter sp. DSM 9736]SNB45080.1 DNA polymerase III, delta prime subunit [Geobacter sp. DSM 9736]
MSFSTLRGLSGTIGLLKRALISGKIAHSYLFTGIEGCGKKQTALAFIQAVFCGRDEGCGTCPSCRKITNLQHPDLHLLEPDGAFIKIDQVRELQKVLSYRSFEAPKKACIIDGADRLNTAAGNALLKTLEEPPGDALLILISSNPGSILPTILSRCQQLNFPALPQGEIEKYLVETGVTADTARVASSLADGSMRKAIDISREDTLQQRASVVGKLSTLSLQNIGSLFRCAEELAADKDQLKEILETLTVFLRDALLIHEGTQEIVNSDLMNLVKEQTGRNSRDSLLEKLHHVDDARRAIERNVNTRLALDILLMRLAGDAGLSCTPPQ